MPADFKLIEVRPPPLKDMYDEWLARIICSAFSAPASPFVSQVNRATSETLRLQATQEGLAPLKAWIKNALDHVIQVCMNEPGLEFVWVGDDAIDPLQQAQTLNILVTAGIKTREEARADLGLGAGAGSLRGRPPRWGSSIQITTSRGDLRRRTTPSIRAAHRGHLRSRAEPWSRDWTMSRLTRLSKAEPPTKPLCRRRKTLRLQHPSDLPRKRTRSRSPCNKRVIALLRRLRNMSVQRHGPMMSQWSVRSRQEQMQPLCV